MNAIISLMQSRLSDTEFNCKFMQFVHLYNIPALCQLNVEIGHELPPETKPKQKDLSAVSKVMSQRTKQLQLLFSNFFHITVHLEAPFGHKSYKILGQPRTFR